MRTKLLLAIDQYESGQAAVDFTIGFAAPPKWDVHVLHVREIPSSLGIVPLESAADAQVLVEEAVNRLREAGIAAEGEVLLDHVSCVAHLIVDEASKRNCSVIILGSLRQRGLVSALGHRTRERILKLSPLPVVITPPARGVLARSMADP